MPTIAIEARSFGPASEQGDSFILDLLQEKISAAELIRRTVEERVHEESMQNILLASAGQRGYLTPEEIEKQASQGSVVSPKAPHRSARSQVEKQVERAQAAFSTGAYLLVVDRQRVLALDEMITLTPDSRVTFLRLTPLAGG